MNRYLFAFVLLLVPSCEEYELVPPPTDNDDGCVPTTTTHTRVPSINYDGNDLILICTNCDIDECNVMGARCQIEGVQCDFFGKLGVCSGCCDSEFGELHCALAQ